MSVKMIIGSVAKQALDGKSSAETALQQAQRNQSATTSPNAPQSNAAISQQMARVAQNSEAVVTTLRAFRTNSTGESIKDYSKAEKLATKVAVDIRKDKEEGLGAHEGVSSEKSSPVLVN